MKLPRLDAFCSSVHLLGMDCVFIDNGYGVASDAYILVKVKISDYFENPEKLNGKMIHRAVWWNMMYANEREVTDNGIKCHYNNYTCVYEFNNYGTYPDYKLVISYDDAKKSNGLTTVALHPYQLKRLTLITESPIQFRFITQNRCILIHNLDFAGLIMPSDFNDVYWAKDYKEMISL